MIQIFDHRHWERQEEIRCKCKFQALKSSTSDSMSKGSSNSGNGGASSGNSSNQNRSQGNNSSTNSSGNSTNNNNKNSRSSQSSKPNSGTSTPKLENKHLGADGKLTTKERRRHLEKNLCLFYGHPGHVAKDCPSLKSTASQAKARGANASSSGTTSGSEKPKA